MRLLGAAIGLLLLAARVTAQTLPVPVLPPADAPEPEPTASPAAPQQGAPARAEPVDAPVAARPRAWEYALGAGVSWDSNVEFLVPGGRGGTAVVPRAALARVFSGPYAQVRASAAGRWSGYPDQEQARQYNADFGLDGSYRRSPSTTWRANASYGVGYSDTSRILLEQGVLLPLVKTRSLSAALGLAKRMGTQTSLRFDERFYRTGFDSPGLIDGESVRSTLAVERHFDSRSTAAIEYSLEYVRSGQTTARPYVTHYGSLQWTRVLSRGSALLVEGGGSYTPDAAGAGLQQKQSFFGGASFSRQVKRSSLTLFVRREVTPAFGIGVSRLELRAGVGAKIPMGRAWELRVAASHFLPETPQGAGRLFSSSDDASGTLGRRLGRRLEASGEARWRRRGATNTLPLIDAFRAGLYVTVASAAP
jgi:hypothetical protein